MTFLRTLLAAALCAVTSCPAAANPVPNRTLYVTSSQGITTLQLRQNNKLVTLAHNNECGASPSWLTLDKAANVLYCTDEGINQANGMLAAFRTAKNGNLTMLNSVQTLHGGVSTALYDDNKGLAMALYSSSAITSFDVSDPSSIRTVSTDIFEFTGPKVHQGPHAARQEVPHPNQVIVDPTGKYLAVPDLGADLVRTFRLQPGSLARIETIANDVSPDSGPRHAAFVQDEASHRTFLYVLAELANNVTAYEVRYLEDETIFFQQVYTTGSHGYDVKVPESAAAAEIAVSPDGKFILVSSCNDSYTTDPKHGTSHSRSLPPNIIQPVDSDIITTFKIDRSTGKLSLVQVASAGGFFPRHFSISKDGTLIAVALQHSERVMLIKRDVATGLLGNYVASTRFKGGAFAVIFDE